MRKQRFIGQTWRLRYGLLYAGVDWTVPLGKVVAVGPDDASVFDERDSRSTKQKYFSAVLRMPFVVEEI